MSLLASRARGSERRRDAVIEALRFIERDWVIGVGTGATVNVLIETLRESGRKIDGAVATSKSTAARLELAGIRLIDLNDVPMLPVYIDGADAATMEGHLVKGLGGALVREKIVAACADRFVCILEGSKLGERLGAGPVPIEVIPIARSFVTRAVEKLGGEVQLREGYATENGNQLLHVHNLDIPDPVDLERRIDHIPGVVESGLFACRPADVLVIASDAGPMVRQSGLANKVPI
jgi:ribose 5-phosphate isomerase A